MPPVAPESCRRRAAHSVAVTVVTVTTSTPDVDWQAFDPLRYLDANYRQVLDADRRICEFLAELYGSLAMSGRRSLRVLDVGTGPNLYPLIAALPAAARIDCGDFSQANNTYLAQELPSPSAHWAMFAEVMADTHPVYTKLPWASLLASRVQPHRVNVYDLPRHAYDVVTSFFVAESITDVRGQFAAVNDDEHGFAAAMASLVKAVVPGGTLVVALMAQSSGYDTAGRPFPATPVDAADVRAALLAAGCPDPTVHVIDASVRPGHAGMFLAVAQIPATTSREVPERAATSVELLHLDVRDCTPEVVLDKVAGLTKVANPTLLAAASLLVLVDDYSLSGRPNRVRKAATAAADTLVTAAAAAGVLIDAVAFESDLVPAAEHLANMVDPTVMRDGVMQVPASTKTDATEVTLWRTGDDGRRRYSCPMMAAAWQLYRLGIVPNPATTRLSDRPTQAEVSFTALDAKYVHVESAVRLILAHVTPPALAESLCRRLGWLLLPETTPTPTTFLDDIVDLVPSEGDVWDRIDVDVYTDANYAEVLGLDRLLATELASFMRGVTGDVVDIGAGSNLYPAMAASRAQSIVAWEYAPVFCAYLEAQAVNASPRWDQFAALVDAPPDWRRALAAKLRVVRGGVLDLPEVSFDAATMLFVAECADGTWSGFAAAMASAMRCLRPGGKLFAAVMAMSDPATYGDVTIPLVRVDIADVQAALRAAGAEDMSVEYLQGPEMQVRDGHAGVVYATATKPTRVL